MQKPQGYDEATPYNGESTALPPGGYVCVIKGAKVETSSTGKEMLALALEIAEGEYKDYYAKIYASRCVKEGKGAKWPCTFRQLTSGNSVSFFKGLTTSIEQSNSGYKWDWEEKTLNNKLVGILFGREQFKNYDGELRFSIKPLYPRSIEAIRSGNFEIPKDKLYSSEASQANGYAAIDETLEDEELPF